MNRIRLCALAGIITTAAFARIIPHPPNVTPIMAMALLGGTYVDSRRLAFLIPCAAMFMSDFVIGFHRLMPFVYGAMAAVVILGFWIRRKKSVKRTLIASVLASALFYVVSNFGVWLVGSLYPKTWEGLLECYVAALPFLRLGLLGNLMYIGLFLGGFSLLENAFPVLKPAMVRRLAGS